MYTELIKVDRFISTSIRRFIENYGLPFGVSASPKPYPNINNVCMLASEFIYAEGLKSLVHLWKAVVRTDDNAAKRWLSRNFVAGFPDEMQQLESNLDQAKFVLGFSINERNVGFNIINGEIVPTVIFDHLGRVGYHQLAKAILGNRRMRSCAHCGAPFEIRNVNRKFCPPLPGKKRSTCENTYNTNLKRQRRKQRASITPNVSP